MNRTKHNEAIQGTLASYVKPRVPVWQCVRDVPGPLWAPLI